MNWNNDILEADIFGTGRKTQEKEEPSAEELLNDYFTEVVEEREEPEEKEEEKKVNSFGNSDWLF